LIYADFDFMMFGAFAHSMHPDLLDLTFLSSLFSDFLPQPALSHIIDAMHRWVDGGWSQAATYVHAARRMPHAARRTPRHEPRPLHNPAD
jgi:hypothetical protein